VEVYVMAKTTEKLSLDHFPIQCHTSSSTPQRVGLIGSLKVDSNLNVLLLVFIIPSKIPGLDEFGMQMVEAFPDSLSREMKELSGRKLSPSRMLSEMADRCRGTIFAGKRTTSKIEIDLDAGRENGRLISQIAAESVKLAIGGSARRPPSKVGSEQKLSKRITIPSVESKILVCPAT